MSLAGDEYKERKKANAFINKQAERINTLLELLGRALSHVHSTDLAHSIEKALVPQSIYYEDNKWWFFDECMDEQGPYCTATAAEDALHAYCEERGIGSD